jgi:hypothetical protein
MDQAAGVRDGRRPGAHVHAACRHAPRRAGPFLLELLFPHDVIHIENLGGDIDKVLDRKVLFGCYPWRFQGGEAAFCRAVVFLEWPETT